MDTLSDEEEHGLLTYMFPTVDTDMLNNVAKIAFMTRTESLTENPRISSGVSTRTSVEIAGLLFDGFTLEEAADITIYPQYDADGGVDSERTFVKQIVQKFIDDGSADDLVWISLLHLGGFIFLSPPQRAGFGLFPQPFFLLDKIMLDNLW